MTNFYSKETRIVENCVLLGKISFVFFFGRIIGLKEPVWLCLTFNVIFFIFIHRKYTRSTHNNPLTRKTSSSCMVYAPLETQYITDKYFWKDVPCDVKAPFICKHNSDLLGFHKLRLSLFDYLVASNHTVKIYFGKFSSISFDSRALKMN